MTVRLDNQGAWSWAMTRFRAPFRSDLMPVNTAPREASPDDLARASPSGPGTAFRWPARLWIVLLVCSGVILLDGLDVSTIVVAIPQIQREFGLSAATAQ